MFQISMPGKRILCTLLCLITAVYLALPVSAAAAQKYESVQRIAAVRYRADDCAQVIGYLEHGTRLEVLEDCGDYYRIDCYDMTGYICRELVHVRDGEYYVNHKMGHRDTTLMQMYPFGQAIPLRYKVYAQAMTHVGVPYVSGGTGPGGFDCSGFTQYVFARLGIDIPRSCDGQLGAGIIIPKDSLRCGDLVLFQRTTGYRALATHVGIYLGDGKLIHAGSRGITVVELDSQYFTQHYLCARRVIPCERVKLPVATSGAAAGSSSFSAGK